MTVVSANRWTMTELLCAICQQPYRPRNWKEDFCRKCYNSYKEAILNREPWVLVCRNEEYRRRNQDCYMDNGIKRHVELVRLSNKWDIDTNNKLVIRDGYHRG